MSIFRVNRSKGYTVMSNHHLRNKELTLKAKGLLSQMLSLPEDWDYTLAGLSSINRESVDAIRTAVLELEKAGYITREQGRDAQGKLTPIVYTIYEQPQKSPSQNKTLPVLENPIAVNSPLLENPKTDNPYMEKPLLEKPISDNPSSENPMQLNKDILNKDILNKESIYQSTATEKQTSESIPHSSKKFSDEMDKIDYPSVVEKIKSQISYDLLMTEGKEKSTLDLIVSLIADVYCHNCKSIFANGITIPVERVAQEFSKIDYEHICYVFESIESVSSEREIKNIRNYLQTCLYNAPHTMDLSYDVQVNYDMHNRMVKEGIKKLE